MNEQGNAPVEQSVEPVAKPDVSKERDYVTLDTHRKLLDEKKKTQAKLEELLNKEKEREEIEARKRGDFDLVLKAREEELKAERDKRINLENTLTTGQKLSAVIDALGGSVESKWYKLIDVSQVAINPETGEIDTMTVAKVAESLKREWPEMSRPKSVLPANAPAGLQSGSGKISREEWLKLPYEKMRELRHNVID